MTPSRVEAVDIIRKMKEEQAADVPCVMGALQFLYWDIPHFVYLW